MLMNLLWFSRLVKKIENFENIISFMMYFEDIYLLTAM